MVVGASTDKYDESRSFKALTGVPVTLKHGFGGVVFLLLLLFCYFGFHTISDGIAVYQYQSIC